MKRAPASAFSASRSGRQPGSGSNGASAAPRNSRGGLEAEARFENEDLSFHERVRQGYLKLAKQEPDRYRVVDASPAPETIQNGIRRVVDGLLGA